MISKFYLKSSKGSVPYYFDFNILKYATYLAKIRANCVIQYGNQQKIYTVMTVRTSRVTLACDFFRCDFDLPLAWAELDLGPTVRSLYTT